MLVRMQTACIYIAILLVLLKIGALYAVKCGSGLPSCPDKYCCEITCTHHNTGDCVSVPAADCTDVRNAGFNTSGVYTVATWSTNTCIQVFCDMDTDGGGWTVFQRRIDGSLNFTRNWSEYVKGFGNLNGEHWLGLLLIREMAARGTTQLRITVIDVNDIEYHRQYGAFNLTTDNFTLNIDGPFSGDALLRSDLYSLMSHNGMRFTTYDMDNDLRDSGNCALLAESGGFWFGHCYYVNLNGAYGSPGSTTYSSFGSQLGILHSGFAPNKWEAFKSSSMLFRRTD